MMVMVKMMMMMIMMMIMMMVSEDGYLLWVVVLDQYPDTSV
jgi:hypothetical protein